MFELHFVKMCGEAEFLHAYVWRNGIVQICAFLTERSLATSSVFVPLQLGSLSVFCGLLCLNANKAPPKVAANQLPATTLFVVGYDKHASIASLLYSRFGVLIGKVVLN